MDLRPRTTWLLQLDEVISQLTALSSQLCDNVLEFSIMMCLLCVAVVLDLFVTIGVRFLCVSCLSD